jgi:putative ABC transport system permease protein
LRLLAAVIAFLGVFSALLAIQLERTRELGVLKAVGMTPAQLRGIVLGETALVGSVAGLYAVPVGTVLALLLTDVINRRSFGWSMDLTLDGGVLVSGILMALFSALLAGIYPAARMARIQPAEALRAE